MENIDLFQKKIGYSFKNEKFLINALTHSSYSNEHTLFPSNERLEFLGDSVLGLIVTNNLYNIFGEFNEGILSKIKAHIVREEALYKFAIGMNFENFILLGNSEKLSDGKHKSSIISDCFEAVVAAIYLDGGFSAAEKWLSKVITKDVYLEAQNNYNDFKTMFQEKHQKKGNAKIVYKLLDEKGPAHLKEFTVGLYLNGKFMAKGVASSKKHAEQNAAKAALNLG